MNTPNLARRALLAACALGLVANAAAGQTVRITGKPAGLVSGTIHVPILAEPPVERLELYVNGVRQSAAPGRFLDATVDAGLYIRRLRLRAVGYDAAGRVAGEDEAVVNDPRPPFRVRLQPPAAGAPQLAATVLRPPDLRIDGVEFFVGERSLGSDASEPYVVAWDGVAAGDAVYARVVARAGDRESHDFHFFGETAHESTDVTLQQVPISVAAGTAPLTVDALTLRDGSDVRPIEGLIPAADQPLHVVLLVDCSESMFEELPVVQAAARQFARELLRPQDRLAVVGFNERSYWLTGWTNDRARIDDAIARIRTGGPTHLYDSAIEMLYELQKMPGRQALVVLTDGADQGSRFELDHLVHYARYAGVPIYPVIKNRALSRWMKLGVGRVQAARVRNLAEETGATAFIVERESELAGVYSRIAAELRQQYLLVFQAESSGGDRWRPLLVTSSRGHRLRAPRGYFP
jgi:VWFA-related protein